jgi:alpha-mannosidase
MRLGKAAVLAALGAVAALAPASGAARFAPPADWVYNTSNEAVPGKLNIHVVAHTHDDTGWLWTVDQYYLQFVRYILDSVVQSLSKDPKRVFNYVEMAFFSRWWEEQSSATKALVRRLVSSGQLRFLNGGWCMHDEASPLYAEMVDQTTRGHQFILKEFGASAAPRATWQIDPFGHSSTQAWLLSAEAGMPSMFWGRIDQDDRQALAAHGDLEYVWRGSRSMGAEAETFGSVNWGGDGNGIYSCPVNFEDYNTIGVQDNPRRRDYNVDRWIEATVTAARRQAGQFRGQHVIWTCGMDFNYKNADTWFHNMDALMHYVNQDGRVHMLYSSPAAYVDAKNADKTLRFKVREDDLFPLHEVKNVYWTGYFSSRVAFKRLVRHTSSLLQAARQAEFLTRGRGLGATEALAMAACASGRSSGGADSTNSSSSSSSSSCALDEDETPRPPLVGSSWTDALEGALAVAMHHDGVSGTAKQHVNNDYAQRISDGRAAAQLGFSDSLNRLLGTHHHWVLCNMLNASVCETSATASAAGQAFSVAAWNPLAQPVNATLRLPVKLKSGGNVYAGFEARQAGSNAALPAQLVPLDARTLALPELYLNWFGLDAAAAKTALEALRNTATHVLVVQIELAPTAPTVIEVRPVPTLAALRGSGIAAASTAAAANDNSRNHNSSATAFDNGVYRIDLDPTTQAITSITNLETGRSCALKLEWGYYEAARGGGAPCPDTGCGDDSMGAMSGAYIFRPQSSTLHFPGQKILSTEVVSGPLQVEIRQRVSPYTSHTVRLTRGERFVEVEYTAGPIPMHDASSHPHDPLEAARSHPLGASSTSATPVGKELVLRYTTCIGSAGVFYTDSNGLEMQRRERNARPAGHAQGGSWKDEPVTSNYYPVNSVIALEGVEGRFSVVTDSTQGGASLSDGQLELMVLRRVFKDDNKGVADPLNETMCGCNGFKDDYVGSHCDEPQGAPCRLFDAQCHCHGLTVRGLHRVLFDSNEERRVSLATQFAPTVLFAASASGSGGAAVAAAAPSALAAPLPDNVHLLTLSSNYARQHDGQVLLRLQHIYAEGEAPHEVAKPVTVSLKNLFSQQAGRLKSARETTLTANLPVEEKYAYKWQAQGDAPKPLQREARKAYDADKLEVTLRPMEIRTFLVTLQAEEESRQQEQQEQKQQQQQQQQQRSEWQVSEA